MTKTEFNIRPLTQMDYTAAWRAMRAFTDTRTEASPDEIWFIEHPAVYTLGQNGKREHVLQAGNIPVLEVDRGGQVTYHGPGQLLVYVLVDLRRRNKGVRDLVTALEKSTIALLAGYGIEAHAKCEAPGVYVDTAKICSLGLRIRRGCSYHGLALNVAMDLEPFSRINPCGHRDLQMTQVSALGGPQELTQIAEDMLPLLAKYL